MAAGSADAGADEIRQLARVYQYDRYVTALLLPRQHREALVVLAAFAGELQRIPFIVNEPMMAAVRLQWWRDELTMAQGVGAGVRSTGHRLCDAVVEVAATRQLPFGLLQGMIDAAEMELDATPLATAAEMRQVLIKSDGVLFELTARVLGAEAPRDVWAGAAVAYGAARLAAQARWRSRLGVQTYVSRDMAMADERPGGPFTELAQLALGDIHSCFQQLNVATRSALLPLATVQPLLRAVTMPQQRAEAATVDLSNFARARAILWAHWRGRV